MDVCVCIDVSGDGPCPISVLFRTARIKHVCCECGCEILPGEKYEQTNGCWDGDWSCYKTCASCRVIRDDLFPCGYYYGELHNLVREYYGMDYLTGEMFDNDHWDEQEKWHIEKSKTVAPDARKDSAND